MIKKRKIEEVIEDARIYGQNFEKNYCDGYSDFQFPFTVSFFEHGKFEVEIVGKKAIVKKIDE